MSANNNRKFAIFAYPNGNDLHLSWMNDTASTTFVGGVWSGVFPVNVLPLLIFECQTKISLLAKK